MDGARWLRLASLASFALLLLGGLGVYFSDRANHCLMTYMFEYPQFVRISVPENDRYPQYGLFSYSEGRLTERARKMKFNGIPVLFLPGNSGSHMQVRSLASVALRKASSHKYDYHFDFFTVSFNGELSGLYGGVLQRQSEFAALAIRRILALYDINKYIESIPKSVIIIGHSMGGVIANRLQRYPPTENATNFAVTLSSPISAPLVNFDTAMDAYYLNMRNEWESSGRLTERKVLISFGGGAKDVMVPASLIPSDYSDFSAMTTAIPRVWTSADHLCIVWCKQFMLVFNRFLFSVVNTTSRQLVEDKSTIMKRVRQHFAFNRSKSLNPDVPRETALMAADAFWYEDNRQICTIHRPEITRMTYLMLRFGFHYERFVAIEAVNLDDKVWLYGCNAAFVEGTSRICKNATSLAELTRWTAAAGDSGRRKIATVNLKDIILYEELFTHIVVKISPTKKPITLNIDINDYASRHIDVDLSMLSLRRKVVKKETAPNALYYELTLRGFDRLHQAYLLYVEPLNSCMGKHYHASAEVHVPWAKNTEYYHYFTHLNKKPMKLRLFSSNPNGNLTEHVKVTILLDPLCIFSISISPSRYTMLSQLARQHYPSLLPYMAAIFLLAARSGLQALAQGRACESLHSALASDSVKPYYILVFARFGMMAVASVPVLAYVFDTRHADDAERRYLFHSLLSVPAYLAALGAAAALAAAAVAALVCSSQLAHRLLLRILWNGGGGALLDKMAAALRRAPVLVSAALACGAPASCGAAALAAGAVFYFFMLSKMYEEYLEDYCFKLLAKVGAQVRLYFNPKREMPYKESSDLLAELECDTTKEIKLKDTEATEIATIESKSNDANLKVVENTDEIKKEDCTDTALEAKEKEESTEVENAEEQDETKKVTKDNIVEVDEQLSGLNFHLIMFFLWMVVTMVNVPALLTWSKNFQYSMLLVPDTSFYPGFVMSVCAGFLWQMDGPRRNLKHYKVLSQIIFVMAVFVVVVAPMATYHISYVCTAAFAAITLQQLLDKEEPALTLTDNSAAPEEPNTTSKADSGEDRKDSKDETAEAEETLYETLKNMKEKVDFNEADNL